jgi:uncharacterized membrane protein YdjX (TVP38/TMEM64 family)
MDAASSSEPSRRRELGRHDAWLRWLAIAVAVAGFFVFLQRAVPIEQALAALEGWIRGLGSWGPIAFGLVYIGATVLLLPGSALTLLGGAVFGLGLGLLTVSLASTTGAAVTFLIARYLARDAVAARLEGKPRFAAVDRAIAEGGWRIVALLRLSPAIPFNLQNYMYGLTAIRFWPCILTSWIAMLPGTLLYVYLGAVGRRGLEAAAGASTATRGQWALLAIGLAATLVVTVYVTRLAQRALAGVSSLQDVAGDREPATPPRRAWVAGTSVATILWLAIALAVSAAAWLAFARGDALRRAIASALGL